MAVTSRKRADSDSAGCDALGALYYIHKSYLWWFKCILTAAVDFWVSLPAFIDFGECDVKQSVPHLLSKGHKRKARAEFQHKVQTQESSSISTGFVGL